MIKTDFNIRINGEPFHCTQLMTVYDLVSYLGVDCDVNIIEYNHHILDLNKLKLVLLKESDEIEIITLVGGG
uniref:Thiamin biosynthesis protein S n=1 Tax=Liagora harveyana TaxID=406718 RepID=A0A1G4NVM5_9FLOR|nr:Thiamin biosynthesis protein S [Liagora harveyana]SCW22664.1 Thiamin biosynthesis protein S [Liagora harveyana]